MSLLPTRRLADVLAHRWPAPAAPAAVDRTADAHARIDRIQEDVHELRRRVDAVRAAVAPGPEPLSQIRGVITRAEAARLPAGALIEAQVGGTRMTLMAVGSQPGAYVDAPTGSWRTLDDLDVRAGIAVLWTPGGTR